MRAAALGRPNRDERDPRLEEPRQRLAAFGAVSHRLDSREQDHARARGVDRIRTLLRRIWAEGRALPSARESAGRTTTRRIVSSRSGRPPVAPASPTRSGARDGLVHASLSAERISANNSDDSVSRRIGVKRRRAATSAEPSADRIRACRGLAAAAGPARSDLASNAAAHRGASRCAACPPEFLTTHRRQLAPSRDPRHGRSREPVRPRRVRRRCTISAIASSDARAPDQRSRRFQVPVRQALGHQRRSGAQRGRRRRRRVRTAARVGDRELGHHSTSRASWADTVNCSTARSR